MGVFVNMGVYWIFIDKINSQYYYLKLKTHKIMNYDFYLEYY